MVQQGRLMPAQSSERIQVGFSENTLNAIKSLADSEGLKKARVCSILIEEALEARGLLNPSRMSETMPSSAGYVFPPLTDDEKTKVIKETGQHPFTVKKPDSMMDQVREEAAKRGWTVETVAKKTENTVREELKSSSDALDQTRQERSDVKRKLIEYREKVIAEQQKLIEDLQELEAMESSLSSSVPSNA